jgi:hypothetical protein
MPLAVSLRALAAAAALSLAAACSPSNYAEPIQEMDSALNTSVEAISALDGKLTRKRNETLRQQALAGDALLQTEGDGCSLAAAGCELAMRVRTGGGVRTVPYPVQSVVPMTGLSELQAYMGKLAAVVNADTTEQITANTQAAASDLIEIDTTLRKAAGSGASDAPSRIEAYEKPVAALITWVAGAYVDTVKLRALADATRAADPIVQRLVDFHKTTAAVALDYDVGEAQQAYVAAQQTYNDARNAGTLTDAILDGYVSAAARFDGVLTAKAADPLQAFGEAHHALTEELNRGTDLTLAQAISLIRELKSRAEAFKEVVEAFQEAGGASGGT